MAPGRAPSDRTTASRTSAMHRWSCWMQRSRKHPTFDARSRIADVLLDVLSCVLSTQRPVALCHRWTLRWRNSPMSTRLKVILVTLVVAIPAFLSARTIWPPNPSNPVPTATQLPLFIVLSALEALLLGLGVAFLIFGFPLVLRASGGRPL